jgi:hypothetical protein
MAKEGVVISASTISNWQTGRNLPHATPHAVDVVYALERAVGTQSGDLVIVLRQTRELQRRGVAPHNHVSIPAGQQSRTLAARRARLERRIYGQRGGLVSRQSLVLIVERERYVVGADGRPRYSKIAYDVRALEEGIDSYWYVRSIAAGSDISIRDSRGCQPGLRLDDKRQYPDAREHLVAIELLLDEPLARGQAHQISYTVHHSYADPDIPGPETEFGHVVRSLATRELHLEIEFDLASVPSELTRCTWTGAPATLIPRLGEPAPDRRRDRQRIVNPASQGHGWIWT